MDTNLYSIDRTSQELRDCGILQILVPAHKDKLSFLLRKPGQGLLKRREILPELGRLPSGRFVCNVVNSLVVSRFPAPAPRFVDPDISRDMIKPGEELAVDPECASEVQDPKKYFLHE